MSKIQYEEAYSFDDVLLLPNYSAIMPEDVDTTTQLTKNISHYAKVTNYAYKTMKRAAASVIMARTGGMGFIHRNMSIKSQVKEILKVKKSESSIIRNPVTTTPDQQISQVKRLMKKHKISGVPVVIDDGTLAGIVTNRDLRFETDVEKKVSEVMTKNGLVIISEKSVHIENPKEKLHKYKIEKLPVVDERRRLTGLITIKDIQKKKKYPFSCKDSVGRLRVGAAVGVGEDMLDRVDELVSAEADVILIDTSHGHSKNVIRAVEKIKAEFSECELIAGNVGTEEGVKDLIKAGVDGVKIGIGPGSICTTRIIAGVGVPQVTAILNCRKASMKNGIPMIADGGIKYSGDITKAIGAGARSVMIGSLFAGADESPGETILYQGRRYKVYRGMGSIEAMKKGSRDRYYQGESVPDENLVPEGIVGRVPYKGPLEGNIHQLIGGLKAGMGYLGCGTIEALRENARFVRISSAGMRESHVHDVVITKEAPNYRID